MKGNKLRKGQAQHPRLGDKCRELKGRKSEEQTQHQIWRLDRDKLDGNRSRRGI